jgi:hypothetical protein
MLPQKRFGTILLVAYLNKILIPGRLLEPSLAIVVEELSSEHTAV